jgi:hypothetical protein
MKAFKSDIYCEHTSASNVQVTNMCIPVNIIGTICCITFLILLMITLNTSQGQGEPVVTQGPNITKQETVSKRVLDTTEKFVASDILHSLARNQYNSTAEQYATVLSPRTDGLIYCGVITFTASEPVKMEIQHPVNLNNTIVNDLQTKDMLKYIDNHPVFASLITPNYSNGSYSFSTFFTGRAIEFTYEKPFTLMYTVDVITNKNTSSEEPTNTTRVQSFAPPTAVNPDPVVLLAEVLPHLSDEMFQEFPYPTLSSDDLSVILARVPADKAEMIVGKLPTDKREEALSKLPTDRREIIAKNFTGQ